MVSLKGKSKGFTIVELLIVIVVIGILATLVIVTFTGIQQKARDSKRKTDIAAVQAALESFYSSNNYYPTASQLNNSTWRGTNMKGFDAEALKDPKGTASTVIAGTTPTATQYAYDAKDAGCTNDTTDPTTLCTNFSINAKLEADGSTISKQSNN
jgi:prepilin-type N-terminal cleavage/methylation domain-containing protein